MDEDVDKMFQNLSEEQRTSVNFLINKALRRYSEWEVYAEKFGFLSITGKMFEGLPDHLSMKDVRELGRHVADNSYREFVNFYYKKFTYDTVLKTLELLGQTYARTFVFERNYDGKNEILIFNHGSGLNTSAYFGEIIRGLMQKLGHNVEISETEDQIVVTVPNVGKDDHTAKARVS